LRGDLDNVLLTALRHDAARRYATVEQLAADLRRYLDHMLVLARPDTFGYRAAEFLRRHRAGVAATGLVALTSLVGAGLILRELAISRAERARAERALTEVCSQSAESLSELYVAI
jgi:serine/threonine-protein kinase